MAPILPYVSHVFPPKQYVCYSSAVATLYRQDRDHHNNNPYSLYLFKDFMIRSKPDMKQEKQSKEKAMSTKGTKFRHVMIGL